MQDSMSQTLERDMFVPDPKSGSDAERLTRPSLTYWKDAFRRFKKNRIAFAAALLLIAIVICAVIIPFISTYDYDQVDYTAVNKPPSAQHWFGTDDLGRDLFVRCWEGARVSLFIGVLVALLNGTIGILYGGISGYFGRGVDNIMMRVCELIASIPQMLWVVLLILIMRPGILPVIIAVSVTGWIGMARLFRGQVFQLKEMEFVIASQTLGGSGLWIIFKHLLPNAMSPIITNMAFAIPTAIFAEAFLSYIGLGLPLPMASWGVLAADGANKLLTHPYQLLFPALLISLTMLCFNILGDSLRDALDPRMRQ